MDSRDSLDRTSDSIDLTESPEKNAKTQKCIEKTNEDTSDNDTDETITYETDELKKSNRKNINTAKKKGRTAKTYTMNLERKRLLKQRRERTLQNAKGKGPAEEYFLTALKASRKSYKALKNSHKRKKDNNGSINDENTNIAMTVYNINNLEIVENNEVNLNLTANAKNADTESMDIDNINMAETEIDKNDDITMSKKNDDNPIMSDKESPLESPANDNIANDEVGESSTEEIPSPLIYGRKADDPTKVKSSKRHRPVKVTPLESPMGNPHMDTDATGTPNTDVFDPKNLGIHEFFFEGEPNGKDLEGIEEDKILEIHRAFQQKLKERDAERERNITKKIQEYEQKYDFINKALLESVAQITEMTKPNHSAATARVKSADKMVMLPSLFDGTKPEVAKQHYKRFNQYIEFQMKSGNIRDPTGKAIELFEHTLDKKALVWFQEHKDKFVDLTTLKTVFLQRYNPWGKTKREQLQSWNILMFNPQKMDVDEHIDLINTLGDMLGQKDESKKDKFIDTMPTIIQMHLITEKDWAAKTKKAKELEHIIRKCDPLAAALPTLAKGTAVPSLYSHITHSNDKDETEILQPLKGPILKNPSLEVEAKVNNSNKNQKTHHHKHKMINTIMRILITITIRKIIEVNPEAIDPIEAKYRTFL